MQSILLRRIIAYRRFVLYQIMHVIVELLSSLAAFLELDLVVGGRKRDHNVKANAGQLYRTAAVVMGSNEIFDGYQTLCRACGSIRFMCFIYFCSISLS